MKNKFDILVVFFVSFVVLATYFRWFILHEIIGGDWVYYYPEALKQIALSVPSWNTWNGNGLGETNPVYSLQSYEYLTIFLSNSLSIPWTIIYKVFWFGFFLFFSFQSACVLLRTVFSRIRFSYAAIAGIIYSTNTYILMVVGGGQMGVSLAYSIAPLVLASFIRLNSNFFSKRSSLKSSIIAGLTLTLQILLDPRIAYITMICVTLYSLFCLLHSFFVDSGKRKQKVYELCLFILYVFAIPLILTTLLNIFWLLPILASRNTPLDTLGEAYTSSGIVRFLSFAAFSQTISLLHPNWPDNIFGKVYFMRPEFLLLPILAYSSLFYMKIKRQVVTKPVELLSSQMRSNVVMILCFIGILGAFLAKGANPPFNELYIWMFENIPGFILFRDSTKFYLLIILSYSVLIPFSLWQIVEHFSLHKNKISPFIGIVPVLFVVVWGLLIHAAILGQLGRTFQKHEAPKEYVQLKDFLYTQPDFFRTMWVPRQSRFTFFSKIHPSVEAEPLYKTRDINKLVSILKTEKAQKLLSLYSIKYIIIPYDSLSEWFLIDRKYNQKQRTEFELKLDTVPWLKKIQSGKITIYEVPSYKEHFTVSDGSRVTHEMIAPDYYTVSFSLDASQDLIFAESYNPYWIFKSDDRTYVSKRTPEGLNSFSLESGSYKGEVVFSLKRYYEYGGVISFVTLFIIIAIFARLTFEKK